tara:strand:- start:523 stop:708 length:186 start_codon:yes stop_codon:yes gene_type:complete
MNKYLEIIIGLLILIVGVSLAVLNSFRFGTAMLVVLRGGIGWLIILIGIVMVGMGISDLKD